MNAKILFAALPIALLLAACGNKGPLVMPQKPVPVEEPTPAAPADPAADPVPEPPPAANPDSPAEGTDG